MLTCQSPPLRVGEPQDPLHVLQRDRGGAPPALRLHRPGRCGRGGRGGARKGGGCEEDGEPGRRTAGQGRREPGRCGTHGGLNPARLPPPPGGRGEEERSVLQPQPARAV